MPNRPRQHQLETASRKALAKSFPNEWVLRDLDQDYGLDAQGEVFTTDGASTGLTFFIQIKATDADLANEPRIWLPYGTIGYYQQLDEPLLIVLYHGSSNRLFARWWHSRDSFYEASRKHTASFTFSAEDEWTEKTPERIVRYLLSRKEVWSPDLPTPFNVALCCSDRQVHGSSFIEIVARIKDEARRNLPWLRFSASFEEPSSSPTRIAFSDEKTMIWMGGMHGTTFSFPEGYDLGLDQFVCLTFFGLGLAMHARGHSGPGAQVLAQYLPISGLMKWPETAIAATRCLVDGKSLDQALELIGCCFKTKDSWESGIAAYTTLSAALMRPQTSNLERNKACFSIEALVDTLDEECPPEMRAAMSYNSANLHRVTGNFRSAIRAYHRAIRTWVGYAERPYFWEELAGCLFLKGRYRASARAYRAALELSGSSDARNRYADALFFSGEYQQAAHEWGEAACAEQCQDAEWYLKKRCSEYLVNQTGITNQNRDPHAARSIDEPEQAMCFDALDPRAWWNLGQARIQEKDWEGAAHSFLLSAMSTRADIDAWLNAAACSHNAKDSDLHTAVVAAGMDCYGNEFLIKYLGGLSDESTQAVAEDVLSLLAIADAKPSQPPIVRIHLRDPNCDVVQTHVISGPSANSDGSGAS